MPMMSLPAASSEGSSPGWVGFLVVVAVGIVVFLVLRKLRPRLREQRYRKWEEAGLLPEQLDPDRPREPGEGRTPDDPPRR